MTLGRYVSFMCSSIRFSAEAHMSIAPAFICVISAGSHGTAKRSCDSAEMMRMKAGATELAASLLYVVKSARISAAGMHDIGIAV